MDTSSARAAAMPLGTSINELVRQHGGLRVLALVLVALTRPGRPAQSQRLPAMSDHLRRDIGLPPAPQGRDWRDLR